MYEHQFDITGFCNICLMHHDIVRDTCIPTKEFPMSEITFHDAMNIHVWVDGGCRGNGTPDASGYCSVRIRGQKPEDTLITVDLPNAKTNNEAEYGAVICALDILRTLFDFPRKGGYNVTIHTDSQLVAYHVSGDFPKCKPKFIPSRDIIRNTITAYANNGITVWLKWIERDEIVAKVGH